MNVNLYVIEDYKNETAFRPQKNKPKQTQSKPIGLLSSVIRRPSPVLGRLSSVLRLLFPDEAQILEFSTQNKQKT